MVFLGHPLIKKNKFEIRDYQIKIAKKCLDKNTLVVLPTGLGKTNIALLVSAEMLNKHFGKIMFLSPTRPLVEQHKKTFINLSEICDLYTITGTIKPEKRKILYKKGRVIFATPQTIENDLKNNILDFKEFILLIIDEAHKSIGNYAYTYIASKYMKEAQKPTILALTASPGGKTKKIEEIKNNLFIEQIEIRTEYDEDIKKYIQERKLIIVEVKLSDEYKTAKKILDKIISDKTEYLVKIGALPTKKISKKLLLEFQNFYFAKAKETKRKEMFFAISKISELIKLDYCLELLETQGAKQLTEYIKKLSSEGTKASKSIFSNYNFREFIKKIANLKEHPKLTKLKEIVEKEKDNIIIFTQYRSTVEEIKRKLSEIEGIKIGILVGQKEGLKQKIQIQTIKDFEEGRYNVLIATSIGEEGLDIKNVKTAIFYEPVPSEIRQIQRRGRVARLSKGKVHILLTKDTKDEIYYWSAYHKEKKMKRILNNKNKLN